MNLRLLLIRVIGVVMVAMVSGFVVYMLQGYATNDPTAGCLVGVLLAFGFVAWQVWRARNIRGSGFMQGFGRKRR
jgi:Flp pilus assembly protein TadB